MKLPFFKSTSNFKSVRGEFNGIGNSNLSDVMNLVCFDSCHTRNARKLVSYLDATPDQIIVCNNRLFFRYYNDLFEFEKDSEGNLIKMNGVHHLKDFSKTTNRKMVCYKGKLYVFPDKIQIGNENWLQFAAMDPVSVALPFKNPRTLCYLRTAESDTFCNEAYLFEVGTRLRFSWVGDEEFTVVNIEKFSFDSGDESDGVLEGLRITLNNDVPHIDSIPQTAVIEYCNSDNRPIGTSLTVGYNHNVVFRGNRIKITSDTPYFETDFGEYFKAGQFVEISGSSETRNNSTVKIIKIEKDCMEFDYSFVGVEEDPKNTITITPRIPDFSHITVAGDRIFGVDNNEGKLYISAIGNPFLFYEDLREQGASRIFEISQKVTGIIPWKASVICFTENGSLRISPYSTDEFKINYLTANGIKKDYSNAVCCIGNIIFYLSEKGVMRYAGENNAENFIPLLKIKNAKYAVASKGFAYFLSDDKIWVFSADGKNIWNENGENISQIFCFDGEMYLLCDKAIYLAESKEQIPIDWSFEINNLPNGNPGRVQPCYFVINYSKNTDCGFNLYCKTSEGEVWKNCGFYKIKGEGQIKIPLLKKYCATFKIKAEGRGAFEPDEWFATYRKIL